MRLCCSDCNFVTTGVTVTGYCRFVCSITGRYVHFLVPCSVPDGLFGFYQRNYNVVDGDLVFSNGERICLNE